MILAQVELHLWNQLFSFFGFDKYHFYKKKIIYFWFFFYCRNFINIIHTRNIKYGDSKLESLECEECRILNRSHIFNRCDFNGW